MQSSNHSIGLQTKWFISLLILITSLGLIWVFCAGKIKENKDKGYIIARAQTAAAALKNYNIMNLSGTINDIYNPDYILLKDTLSHIKHGNNDVRFVYLMAQSNIADKLLFLVDNEPADSPDISLPGDIYEDTTPEELIGFATATSFVEGPHTDEWGTWISGFAPIINQYTGQTIALLGMDIDASLWQKNINQARALPIVITLSVLVFLTLIYLFERKVDKIRDELISISSHQLSTPLTGIKWYAEALIDGDMGELNPKQLEYIKDISASAERLIHLTKNLLNVARIERGEVLEIKKEEVNISEILDSVLLDLVQLIKSKKVSVHKAKNFPTKVVLKVDKEKIQQVFQNLVSNAVKYSNPESEVILSFEEKGNFDIFSIKDSGLGIPKSDQSKIFDKFFRGSNVGGDELKGTGLGLYLARMIVKKHGGNLNFQSEEGKGTTFFVYLPKK